MKFTARIFYTGGWLILIVMLKHASSQEEQPPTDDATPENGSETTTVSSDSGGTSKPGNDSQVPVTNKPVSSDEFRGPAAWLRICQPGAGKYVGAVSKGKDKCSDGYWFKDTLKVGCACGHGVWMFAKGWCDHTARIIIAKDGACFNVNKDVKYIRHIGWANNAFVPYHFVATSGLEYIQDVPRVTTISGRATHFHPEYNQHIGTIFREMAVESMTGRFCLSQSGNTSRPLALKYFVPKMPYLEERNCFAYAHQDLSRFEYDAGYALNEGLTLTNEITRPFNKSKSWVTDADNKTCSLECPASQALILNPPKNNSLGSDYNDPMLDEYFLEEKERNSNNNSTTTTTAKPNASSDKKYALSNKTMVEIQEQTKRIIRLNIKSSVKNVLSPTVKYMDYKLLQKARTILAKVCPDGELPGTVLLGMHRMFRITVNESFFHYPFNQLGDGSDTPQILSTLNTCFDEAKPMTFLYSETGSTNGSKCEPGKFLGISYEFTTNASTLTKTIEATLPNFLWSNITKLDMVVETAWKTVMFTHYYCARHFKLTSLDFSRFEQKMERFFNRWIQHRWFYPGLSLQGYQYAYQMFNLERFSVALDRCVAAAHSFSVYTKWIKRPTYSKHMGGKMFEEQTEIPDDIAGRTSLDAINPKLNQFNNKAYCLPYWHAPASNPGLDYNPAKDYQPGCVKYLKEEWSGPFTPAFGKSTGWRNTVEIV